MPTQRLASSTLPLAAFKAIVIGGSIAAALDLMFAISFAAFNGTSPATLLQTIASGLIGRDAFSGGNNAALLGFVLHFALSYGWAALFVFAARFQPHLTDHPVVTGIAFGLLVFFCMRLIVLPLSAFPVPVHFKPLATFLDLLSHMFLFGVPIVAFARRHVRA